MPHEADLDILLITATPMEMRGALSGLLPETSMASLPFWERLAAKNFFIPCGEPPVLQFGRVRLWLSLSGVGPVAAAASLGSLMAARYVQAAGHGFDGILNMGFAGSYTLRKAPVGSIVIASEERFPEYGIWPEANEIVAAKGTARSGATGSPSPLSFPQCILPNGPVFDTLPLCPRDALGKMGLNWHSDFLTGTSVTVAGVSGTAKRAGRMASLTRGLTENMEGFSLAMAAKAWQVPFLEARAVSNQAGCRPPYTWDIPRALSSLGEGLYRLLGQAWAR